MRIDIFVDVVCPWCFIGKRRLERALAMRPAVPIQTMWRPFQLNPDMPAEGRPSAEFFAEKFGSAALMQERRGTVAQIGKSVGIAFAFDRIEREPNTLDAHRLIRYALKRGRGDAVIEALFTAHFIEGRFIGDRAILATIAGASGLDADEAAWFLASGDETDTIVAEEQQAHRAGVNGVPCFVFDGQYAVSGAQEPESFLPILDLAKNATAANESAQN
jgi:predicted DsbA family dithiol-disulfide isomerase